MKNCCHKCTAGGITTDFGRQLYDSTAADDRWTLHFCPKMCGTEDLGENRVMWGICRESSDLEKTECCRNCNYFS
tara:strand:- start:441 stop:665 length:225 start_codon:yes stop_codon:yes gene_type:complete